MAGSEVVMPLPSNSRHITLGGLLTVMAEAEVLCRAHGQKQFQILVPPATLEYVGRSFLDSVIGSTEMGTWETSTGRPSQHLPFAGLGLEKAAAHETSLLFRLQRQTGLPPTLTWRKTMSEPVDKILVSQTKSAIVIHLRNNTRGHESESAADGKVWAEAINRIHDSSGSPLVLIGDDPRPDDFRSACRAPVIDIGGTPIGWQLYVASSARMYLGMASGLASAALFSSTPTTIFKHPKHHNAEMIREFGERSRIPLWRPCQILIRRQPTAPEIHSEWRMMNGHNL